jgi:hypothetical protein
VYLPQRHTQDYEAAVALEPRDYRSHFYLASLLATAKDIGARDGAGAVRAAQKAVELRKNRLTFPALAAAFTAIGDRDKRSQPIRL